MENSQRITRVSRNLRRICTGLIFALPIACALFWTFFNRFYALMPMIPLPVHVNPDLTSLTRFLAFLVDLIPLVAVIYGLQKLRRLFGLYENRLIFSEQNVDCFRRLGRALILWVIGDIVRNSLLSIVLTLHNPPGQRVITFGLYSADFTGIFVGIVILVISWVMDEGRKIQEDQALIV